MQYDKRTITHLVRRRTQIRPKCTGSPRPRAYAYPKVTIACQHMFEMREGMDNSLLIEHLYLTLICIPQPFLRHANGIAVLVSPLVGDLINGCFVGFDGDVPEADADGLQGGYVDGCSGVVEEALVASDVVKVVGAHGGRRQER